MTDGSLVSGTLYNLEVTDVNFENFYIYNSQFMKDLQNAAEKYEDYGEKGYETSIQALYADYENKDKLDLSTKNCTVNNEYKRADIQNINWGGIDNSNCRKMWLDGRVLDEDDFSDMPNLETLVLVDSKIYRLDEEVIRINSHSLKNLIIDGKAAIDYIDHFDFTGCPNLEVVSLPDDSQETNLDGLKGLKHLKQLAFGTPNSNAYYVNIQILNDFEDRIDLVSKPFPTDHLSLGHTLSNFISDISGINGSELEVLNISFLKRLSSDSLLDTVKTLPNLKQIVGFEVNNAGMCSDELIEYCEEHGIEHPFTEKSLEIKHKLQEIVSSEITEDMDEEEKIWALSKYIMADMEYDYDLTVDVDDNSDKIRKGWGENLYYSVIEGEGICAGFAMYAQNLFIEAGITTYKISGLAHTWNLVEIDDEYYYVDLTNADHYMYLEGTVPDETIKERMSEYYLSPVEEEWPFYTYALPIEAEEKVEYAEQKRKVVEETENLESIGKVRYIVHPDKDSLGQENYDRLSGMIGILCALGLAKKAGSKQKMLQKGEMTSRDKSGEIGANSLKEVVTILKRLQKLDQLIGKRNIAETEKTRNRKARDLERQIIQAREEEDIK